MYIHKNFKVQVKLSVSVSSNQAMKFRYRHPKHQFNFRHDLKGYKEGKNIPCQWQAVEEVDNSLFWLDSLPAHRLTDCFVYMDNDE